jgi:hypothetical protein
MPPKRSLRRKCIFPVKNKTLMNQPNRFFHMLQTEQPPLRQANLGFRLWSGNCSVVPLTSLVVDKGEIKAVWDIRIAHIWFQYGYRSRFLRVGKFGS